MSFDDLLEDMILDESFSGVILGIQQDQVVLEHSSGLAVRSNHIRNSLQTRFGIASGSKTFTAVAVCQLVERGLLTFDTCISEYLDTIFPQVDPRVTVHHLLTHTSGLPDYFDETLYEASEYEDVWHNRPCYTMQTPADFLPLFQNKAQSFVPGDRFAYNNAGFIVLGLLVERITGVRFTEYVTENVLIPSGMLDSGYFPMNELPDRVALGYLDDGRTNIFSVPIVGGPDGGAFVTACDLANFWRNLRKGSLLLPDTLFSMLTPHVSTGTDHRYYGYGLWIGTDKDKVSKYSIIGTDPGTSCYSAFLPDEDITLVILSNTTRGAFPLAKRFEQWLEMRRAVL